MTRLIMLLLVLTLPLQVSAEIYSWTDAAGTVHFTEDLGSVPKNYRAKALRRASGAEMSAPVAESEASTAEGVPTAERTQAEASQGAVAPAPGVTPATRYANRSAADWQTEFRALRQKLAQIEQQQEQLRKEGGDGTKLLSRQQVEDINTRNKQLYDEYEATRLRFNQLVEQANQAGLPPEFSR